MPFGPAILFLGIYPKEMKTCPEKYWNKNIHFNIIYCSIKLETIKLSVNKKTDKPVMAYLHNGMLLSNKKEETTDTHNNMNESLKDYWVKGARPPKLYSITGKCNIWRYKSEQCLSKGSACRLWREFSRVRIF